MLQNSCFSCEIKRMMRMFTRKLSLRRNIYKVLLAFSATTLILLIYYWPMKTAVKSGVENVDDLPELNDQNPQTQDRKSSLILFVGIYSAPVRIDRRTGLRETWLGKQCHPSKKAVCRFFTDGQDAKGNELQGEIRRKLDKESLLYDDLLLAQTPGGVNFARRYLWMAEWASKRYNFQYFLRVDDDFFVCFHKLLLELEFHRPKERFQWGWLHCSKEYVALDSGFSLVSKDLIESFLSKINTTLLCHTWDGQAIARWLKDIPNIITFGDNGRIFHRTFYSKEKAAKKTEICHTALGIHKSYPEEMRLYWSIYQRENKTISSPVPLVVHHCHFPLTFDYKHFRGTTWFSEPKLCKDNPIWDVDHDFFKGRQEEPQ